MFKIMFVCHGNICRSPMAEFITKKIVSDLGLSSEYLIVSRATSPEEYGNPIYPPAQRELSRRCVSFDRREATLLGLDEYEKYDVIAVMDDKNLRNIKRYFPDDPDCKIRKLMSFCGTSSDVSDPWYSRDFDKAYEDIYKGCRALLEYITEK